VAVFDALPNCPRPETCSRLETIQRDFVDWVDAGWRASAFRLSQRMVTDGDHALCSEDLCRDSHAEGLTLVLCVKMRVSAVAFA
jgi:hypothetical protein